MSIGKTLIYSFLCAGVAVGVTGGFSLYTLWRLRQHATPDLDLAREIARAESLLVMALPIVCGFVVGLGFVVARWARLRVDELAQLELTRARAKGRMREGDQPDLMPSGRRATTQGRHDDDDDHHAAAAEAKRFADNVINSMFDILIVTDPDLKIVTVNQAACELLEYRELELIGRPVQTLFRQESYALSPPIDTLLRNSTTRDNELTYVTSSGRHIAALVSASTMRDAAGRTVAIITVGKDIGARKQIESDLLEAKQLAEAANRAKSHFLANMSHEIRTPMTAILGYADLLNNASLGADAREQYAQTIRRNGQHLLQIINDILDVSKIEAGRMTIERLACSPHQIVEDVAALMAGRAADKNLSFDVRYAGPIPRTVHTDPTRLRQVLMNLLGNAIKFTTHGGVSLVVRLEQSKVREGEAHAEPTRPGMEAFGSTGASPSQASNILRFEVTDTGIGLDADQLNSLFRPFVQADASTTRKFGGTGLGLTISKRLAEMLGGDISVGSVPGQGSTFSLLVDVGDLADVSMLQYPLSQFTASGRSVVAAAASEAGASSSSNRRGVGNPNRLAGRVLVAEDGPDNRVLIHHILNETGLDVTLVENGAIAREQALQALAGGCAFDLILTDMQMPELDGYSMTQSLRASGYTGPIVALTAHAMEGDREKCLAAGCDDVVVKPIDFDVLLATVRRYVKEVAQTAPTTPPISETVTSTATTKTVGGARVKPQLLERFVGGLSQRAEAIQAALAEADRKRLQTLAHQLKGAAGGYGFPAISEAAGQIEESAERDLAEIHAAVKDLIELCGRVREAAAPLPRDFGNEAAAYQTTR